jgi:hypothetical protein
MDFKIIKLEPQVLVARDLTQDGKDIVTITSFEPTDDDDDDQIRQEVISMPSKSLARAFVRDFSEDSAVEFQNRHFENDRV